MSTKAEHWAAAMVNAEALEPRACQGPRGWIAQMVRDGSVPIVRLNSGDYTAEDALRLALWIMENCGTSGFLAPSPACDAASGGA